MKLVSYLSGIPPQNNNKEKPLILQYMVNGVNHVGDLGICHTGMNIVDCDVALGVDGVLTATLMVALAVLVVLVAVAEDAARVPDGWPLEAARI